LDCLQRLQFGRQLSHRLEHALMILLLPQHLRNFIHGFENLDELRADNVLVIFNLGHE
jgi:hypothetical protein